MKKLMKKRLFCALSLSAVVLGLAGCGGTPSASSSAGASEGTSSSVNAADSETGVDATKAVDVIWWNNYQVPTISDTLTEAQARAKSTYREYYYAKDLIDAFHKEHTNINVTQVYKGSYGDIKTAVTTAIGTGDTPAIASCYGDSVATFNDAEATLDVSPYVDNAKIGFGMKTTSAGAYVEDATTALSDYNQNYLNIEKGMYNGKFLSMPYSKSSETLVVNKTVFDKVGAGKAGTDTTKTSDGKTVAVYTAPEAADTKTAYTIPTNFTDMIKVAKKMKTDFPTLFAEQRDSDGYFKAIPFCWDSTENMFIALCENLGIKYTNGAGANLASQILFNNDDAKKLVTQLKKWNNEGLICTQNQLPITNAAKGYHDYSSNKVVAGNIFMAVSSTAGARYFATDGGFEAKINPQMSVDSSIYDLGTPDATKKAKVISQGPSLTFFKKADVNVQRGAWEFYKYLTNATNSANLAVNTSYFPLRTSSYNSETVKTLTYAGTAGTTAEAKYAAKTSCYSGQSLNLNSTYTTSGQYFLSDVFSYSAAARTAVGNLLNAVFNDTTAKTDAEITTLVNAKFQTAYEAATK